MNHKTELKRTRAGSVAWTDELYQRLRSAASESSIAATIEAIITGASDNGIHLAVCVEPYLTFILEGKKTIESRFSLHRHAPFGQVHEGDFVLLKKSSGPVCGMCRVSRVWYYRLDPKTWSDIEKYSAALCMDDSAFWAAKRGASFATLMQVSDVVPLPSFTVPKTDPRSWVVVRAFQKQSRLT